MQIGRHNSGFSIIPIVDSIQTVFQKYIWFGFANGEKVSIFYNSASVLVETLVNQFTSRILTFNFLYDKHSLIEGK